MTIRVELPTVVLDIDTATEDVNRAIALELLGRALDVACGLPDTLVAKIESGLAEEGISR